ncbi:TlpA family protein disulfide reductase [Spirosoma sp. BT702]|uniref:TlpA family protein disulfide reductase n=1 Tax=Spirosoma profusum TaxID=2771354 RepID=A0A926XZ97_9BACT|nr:TlpA disulfide reductase family protein [Spirosoma profusum]MBD2703060.1 TlpA family protein disulfide reductase [Spirosoma profusum]
MKNVSVFLFVVVTFIFTNYGLIAQPNVRIERGAISRQIRIDETTKITDKKTGKTISYQEYRELTKADPFGYHLEPVFDEYGEVSAYKLRSVTSEERQTHSFTSFAPALRPKVGEPMPEFVMKGIDDKVYRLSDLKGHVVVLSFWISLRKPFWGPKQAQGFAEVLRPYRSETDPLSLGVLQDSKEDIERFLASETLPFIPVPNSYGFHQKFHITGSPSFMVIDKAGNVAAYIEGQDYDQLQKALQVVIR